MPARVDRPNVTGVAVNAGTAMALYEPVPLEGLAGSKPLDFQVFLRTDPDTWILYRDLDAVVDDAHLGRLRAEGVEHLWVRRSERWAYYRRVEDQLDRVMSDRTIPVEQRATVLHGVASDVARDLLRRRPDGDGVRRAQRMLQSTSGLMLREEKGFQAVRKLLRASEELSQHSLTVSFLCMGLARHAMCADPVILMRAGLAGLLHDVGRIGHGEGDDHEHPIRGARELDKLGIEADVVEAVRFHHEGYDGGGYPDGLRGGAIPELARLVMVADTFEKIFTSRRPQVGVFDALRVMAHSRRGSYDPRIAGAFVQVFG